MLLGLLFFGLVVVWFGLFDWLVGCVFVLMLFVLGWWFSLWVGCLVFVVGFS